MWRNGHHKYARCCLAVVYVIRLLTQNAHVCLACRCCSGCSGAADVPAVHKVQSWWQCANVPLPDARAQTPAQALTWSLCESLGEPVVGCGCGQQCRALVQPGNGERAAGQLWCRELVSTDFRLVLMPWAVPCSAYAGAPWCYDCPACPAARRAQGSCWAALQGEQSPACLQGLCVSD